ncbi:hypothetical protein, partial [Flagellimonas alvinocaridis]|uniref:hypothetical protein n=1 Tax=Flagellimonas alvinocaridis TaxID=2530200 RepID=UPI001F3BD8B7
MLKELCTKKQKLNVKEKSFYIEHINAMIQSDMPEKLNDHGCPTISVMIGKHRVDNVMLDLGASVNVLPYSIYLELGLTNLKPTRTILQLADKSLRYPRG